ncbi:hypothetical protein [Pleionea litopenaei]|uniref:Lipoprotein n=1 Tax=Pleionea litopenaei TaxID=3070815 RepID=A0AA51X7G1_9GAMM|nr:hypothetical protein [Pleionea sp. HL-JVS1]WMS88282.1 hypothetical protein Q9312_05030 [Pleionea sp. HL-JVS1]
MTRRIALVGIVILLVASCGFKKGYKAPVSEKSATLYLPNPYSKSGLFSTENTRYTEVFFGVSDNQGCAELYSADVPEKKLRNGYIEQQVPHNRNVFVKYLQVMNRTVCNATGYFYTNAKVSYKVLVRPTQYGCRLEIKATQENGISFTVPVQQAYTDPWRGVRVCTTEAAL